MDSTTKNETRKLSIPAIQCRQSQYTFYALKLTATQLQEITYVAKRQDDQTKGYQRRW